MSHPALRLRIHSESDVTRSVIEASRFAQRLGFPPQDCQAVSTAVSELTRNILKYAVEGRLIIEEIESGRRHGIQIRAEDQGPGIADVAAAMRDHFSSGGTLGLGLPGVRRLMDDFVIKSTLGVGTTVVIRKWRELPKAPTAAPFRATASRSSTPQEHEADREVDVLRGDIGSVNDVDCAFFVRPCLGERVSGDIVVAERRGGHVFLALLDALGHGPTAAAIAGKAAEFLKSAWRSDPTRTMKDLHEFLRGSDGAAAGLCAVDVRAHMVRYVGVGNTVIRIIGTQEKRAFSTPGTLGHQIRSPREQILSLESSDVLLLYSDGVRENFDLSEYPQMRYESPKVIARSIVTRFGKRHDDSSCVALRYKP